MTGNVSTQNVDAMRPLLKDKKSVWYVDSQRHAVTREHVARPSNLARLNQTLEPKP